METLFDDMPDPEPEGPPDAEPWMLATGLTATQKSIAAAFDVPLDILVEPTVPPPVSPTPTAILLRLPLTLVAHHSWEEEAQLTFEAETPFADCRVVLTGTRWQALGKPQVLTVQIMPG